MSPAERPRVRQRLDESFARQSVLHERVVWIMGSALSGAEALLAGLAGLPGWAGRPEPTELMAEGVGRVFANRHFGRRERGAWTLMGETDEGTFLHEARVLADAPLRVLARDSGARRLVEYSPGHARWVTQLAALYPDARLVHMVRDGRNVAADLVATEGVTFAAASERWCTDVRAIVEAGPLDNLTVVRFETFAGNPAATLEGLFGELDEAVGSDILSEAAERAAMVLHGLERASPSRELSEIVERDGGDLLAANGYEVGGAAASIHRSSGPQGRRQARSGRHRARLGRSRPSAPALPGVWTRSPSQTRSAPGPTQSPWSERMVIVLACWRSGTTWLHHLLLSHPELTGVPSGESWLFDCLGPIWANFSDAPGQLAAYLEEDDFVAACRTFSDDTLSAARDRHSPHATWFVDKTPQHIWRLRLINRLYPNAWYVHLLRDGRDVAHSMWRSPVGPPDIPTAATLWRRAVTEVRAWSGRLARFREIRYEDLLADPVAEVSGLLHWMGLQAGEETERTLRRRADERVSPFATPGRPGSRKWEELDQAQTSSLYAGAGDLLVELGYVEASELLEVLGERSAG